MRMTPGYKVGAVGRPLGWIPIQGTRRTGALLGHKHPHIVGARIPRGVHPHLHPAYPDTSVRPYLYRGTPWRTSRGTGRPDARPGCGRHGPTRAAALV